MEILFLESNNVDQTKNAKHSNHEAVSQRVQGGEVWPVPGTVRSRASWQRREHACQPSEGEGNVCSRGWEMLQCLKLELDREHVKLRQVCSAD